jgi:AhpD family alkylhydroperoxidase
MENGGNADEEAHLKSCAVCSALVQDLEQIAESARLLLPMQDPSPRVWTGIREALTKITQMFSRKGESIMAGSRRRAEVEREIKSTVGIVPSFFKRVPDEFLDLEWELFKRLELGHTLIPNKYKELMGVALHSRTKCNYCTLFHTEAAKLFGASDQEIQEAAHYAKMSLGWSAYLNGIRQDYDQFQKEVQQMGKFLCEHKAAA